MRETGIYQQLGSLGSFIPDSLPPTDPSLEMSAEMMSLLLALIKQEKLQELPLNFYLSIQ